VYDTLSCDIAPRSQNQKKTKFGEFRGSKEFLLIFLLTKLSEASTSAWVSRGHHRRTVPLGLGLALA
jgi:hypothetical protein